MEITRNEYRRAFMEAINNEIGELNKHGADIMTGLLCAAAMSRVVHQAEVKFFGEEKSEPEEAAEEVPTGVTSN